MFLLFFCCTTLKATEHKDALCPKQRDQDWSLQLQEFPLKRFSNLGLKENILKRGIKAYQNAFKKGDTKSCLLTVIDYSRHSKHKRLWTINLSTQKLVFHEWVSHGVGSDPDKNGQMDKAGNTSNSNMTSLGLFKTSETYYGKHGYSLRLDGLEKGFNDQARERAIVIHQADYMTSSFIKIRGRAGLSHGCPAVSPRISEQLITTLKEGSLIFAYYPSDSWLKKSTYLK